MRAQRVQPTGEHDDEPVHGLPGMLPPGEHILWQGAPEWRALAVQAFHLRTVALYFGLMLAWRVGATWQDTGSASATLWALAWPLPLAALGLGLLALLAWLTARTTAYTLTNKRVVMRVGIVLSVSFNLPLSRIDSAALRPRGGDSGDISLHLAGRDRIAYLHLWPHARPWRLGRPEPMMRALADGRGVAQQLAAALQATLDAATAARRPLPPLADARALAAADAANGHHHAPQPAAA